MLADFEGRRDSRKRRRVSERRRAFGRLTGNGAPHLQSSHSGGSSSERWQSASDTTNSSGEPQPAAGLAGDAACLFSGAPNNSWGSSLRDDSPLGSDRSRIKMKVQFHITVAPDDEPLLLDPSQLTAVSLASAGTSGTASEHPASPPTIGDQIHERLQRQNTLSQRRRAKLMALHHQSAAASTGNGPEGSPPPTPPALGMAAMRAPLVGSAPQLNASRQSEPATPAAASYSNPPNMFQQQPSGAPVPQRELIYFKRDGQRFGHEFTLKLAVDRTYRCLLKVRPLLPVAAITVHDQQASFVDCSGGGGATSGAAGAPRSPVREQRASSWQCGPSALHLSTGGPPLAGGKLAAQNQRQHLQRAATGQIRSPLAAGPAPSLAGPMQLARQQQQQREILAKRQHSQMLRHFAASHCSISSSSAHLIGSQLIYMFDWSASRFEVNKNKARTQVQLVIKFRNGQMLTLPLQVKFYEQQSRQHLAWGSQLHFIDYDCSINSSGQMSVERINYY